MYRAGDWKTTEAGIAVAEAVERSSGTLPTVW